MTNQSEEAYNMSSELEALQQQNKQLKATLHYLHRDAFIARACFAKGLEMCMTIEQEEDEKTLKRAAEGFRSSLARCREYLDEIDQGNESLKKYFDVVGENAVFIRDYI